MAKNKIITSQGNVQFINSKGRTINMHPMHCYYVAENDTISFLFIYMKDYSGQAFFASQYEDLEVNGETYDNIDDLKDAINYAFAKAGAQARTEIVDELPDDPFTNTIYLLPKEHGEGYDEYIWNEDEGWQLIGDTDIEFERYLKIDDFNPYSADTKDYIDAVSGNTVQNASDIVFLSGAVDTEIAAREAADTALSGAIDTVAADLVTESQRAVSAETQLQNNINTVNGRVDAEQIARAQADTALSGAIDTVVSNLANEVSARTAADEALDSKIDTVSGDVISETSRAEGAEAALGGRIDDEASARTSADTALQTAINNEASARTDADNALSGAVDTVSSGLTEEIQRAQDAESAIDSKVDALSGEVQTMGEEAVVDAAYVSSSTTIDFYNASGDVVAQVDATDFIKDGMIEDVRIENGYLIIDFNTASGIEDISIPLTDIFDPDNYYDKDAIDDIVSGLNESIDTKLAISDFETYSAATDAVIVSKFDASAITAYSTTVEVGNAIEAATSGKVNTSDFEIYSGAVETALGNKFDASAITAYSTSSEVSAEIEAATSGKVNTSDFEIYSGNVETALGNKADLSALTEDEAVWGQALNDINSRINTISGDVSSLGSDKLNVSDFNTYSGATDAVIASKFDASAITAYSTTVEVGNAIEAATSGKVNTSDFETYSGAVETALSGKADASDLSSLSGTVTGHTADTTIHVTTAQTAAWDAKSDFSGSYNDLSNKLSAGTNITINDNVINAIVPTTTSAVTSGSTDVVESGAVYSQMGGLKLEKITQSAYDALVQGGTVDVNTLYIIID